MENIFMCYTIQINLTREQLEKRFKANFEKNAPYKKGQRVNAFSLPEVPVIAAENKNTIQLLQWGLIPFWSKDEASAQNIRLKTFNARAETLLEKPSFRHCVERRRCVVLTNGFYEWQHLGKLKKPFYLSLKDDIAMPMAGLYDSWTNEGNGEILKTFTIITTQANPLMAEIHNTKKRMPVILNKEDEQRWVDPALSQKEALILLKSFDENQMVAEELDPALFKKGSQGAIQGSLF